MKSLKKRSDQVMVGDLVRTHKTKQVGIVTEVFQSERAPRIDEHGNTLPALKAVKIIFPKTGQTKCTVHNEIEVISESR